MNNPLKQKAYRVSFIPIQTLEYEYLVVAYDEDGAYYEAKELLQEDIGWDAAKDFHLRTLEEETLSWDSPTSLIQKLSKKLRQK